MLNRSAVVIGHEPAFFGWLKTTGKSSDDIETLRQTSDRSVYLRSAPRRRCRRRHAHLGEQRVFG
jgi:hypothetical protein